ncbi:MAG: hypothetical protein AN481_11190 [Aphanizomenon flos-aquae LD13]|uniref:Uncharacterized protein n=1 Tax=Aphanizomenon flos-aquae LD13 TaxID=1710894 RepID=A0A1B7VWC1_APHFL|nr:hypothetical protein [Aphanizomenon flos-aquae UKL13-PB]OBQ25269.1 MAG: hypothetical protein AN481_11190 [Aphanizomenon flos-aquae LD13]HCQ21215.1 hypothetical protein [Anabaena sp. UBA12330]
MTLQIKSINSLEVKELMLAILLSTLIHESVQAQSVFSITRPSIQTPSVSITRPSIQTPSVTITRPSIQTPSVIQLPTEFIVESADGITPSYVSASKKNNDPSIIETGTGDKTIPITPLPPNTPGTLSTINVVVPFENQVSKDSVEFTVNKGDSGIDSVNLSFPVTVPALD